MVRAQRRMNDEMDGNSHTQVQNGSYFFGKIMQIFIIQALASPEGEQNACQPTIKIKRRLSQTFMLPTAAVYRSQFSDKMF